MSNIQYDTGWKVKRKKVYGSGVVKGCSLTLTSRTLGVVESVELTSLV